MFFSQGAVGASALSSVDNERQLAMPVRHANVMIGK